MDNAGCVHFCPSVLMICDEPCPGWQITASVGVHSSIEVAGFVLFVKGLFATVLNFNITYPGPMVVGRGVACSTAEMWRQVPESDASLTSL